MSVFVVWSALALIYLVSTLSGPFAREELELMAELFGISKDACFLVLAAVSFFYTSPMAFLFYVAMRSR